jgi:hypothetical protein
MIMRSKRTRAQLNCDVELNNNECKVIELFKAEHAAALT